MNYARGKRGLGEGWACGHGAGSLAGGSRREGGKVCLSPKRFQPLPRDSRLYLELLGWHGG